MATLKDAYIMTHELAHTFDIYLNYILDNKGKNIKNIKGHNILTESTAIAFEELFTRYLFEKNIINKYEYVEKIILARKNHTYTQCETSYGRLAMMNIMKENQKITGDDLKKILSRLDLTPIQKKGYVESLVKGGVKMFDVALGYAMSGMISPTIEKNIIDGNIENIKEYLKFSRINDFEAAINSLGISIDEKGIEQLQNNIKKITYNIERDEIIRDQNED